MLLNGGVFKADALRKRLLEVLGDWRGGADATKLLEGVHDLDHAVAQGAAYYGCNPAFTVKMFRRNLQRIATQEVQASIGEEAAIQTLVFGSDDYAEMKAARSEQREPKYRGR